MRFDNKKVGSVRRALILAVVLVFVDALLMNQGAIALIVGALLVLVVVPMTFLPQFAPVRRQRLRNLGIYLAAVMLVFVLNAANNRIAAARAERLIAAVKGYHATHHRYPETLDELVPEFIERVPLAKYTLAFNQFFYINLEGRASLFYMALPPFGRPTYSFADDSWIYLD